MASRRGGAGGKGRQGGGGGQGRGKGGASSSSGGGWSSWEPWGWGSGGAWWWQAGAEAGFDRPAGSDRPGGAPWPDRRRPEERQGRGEAAIGTALGWLKESAQEELDPGQVYSFVVAADLNAVPRERWATMREALMQAHGCTVAFRKNRHSRNEQVVPYRVTVRGLEAELAAEAFLDTLCTAFPDVVEPGDIEALPLPETNVQEFVAGWLRSFTTRGASEVVMVNLEDARARRQPQKVDRRRAPAALRSKDLKRLAARRREAGPDRPEPEAGPDRRAQAASPDRPEATDVPMQDASAPAAEGPGEGVRDAAWEWLVAADEKMAAARADVEMAPAPRAELATEPEQERAPTEVATPTEEPEADWDRTSPSPEADMKAAVESTLLAWQQETLLPHARAVVSTWGWFFREAVGQLEKDWPAEAGVTAPQAGLTAPQAGLTAPEAGLTAPRNMITAEGFHGNLFSVALCVTTFRRNHQIMQALPVNLCLSLPHKDTFFWVVLDFNEDDTLENHIMQEYGDLVLMEHCGTSAACHGGQHITAPRRRTRPTSPPRVSPPTSIGSTSSTWTTTTS